MSTPQVNLIADDLRDQVAALRADLARLTATASDGVSTGLDAARKQVEKSGHDARVGMVDAVVANPLGAIGIAAGLGFLVGFMTRR